MLHCIAWFLILFAPIFFLEDRGIGVFKYPLIYLNLLFFWSYKIAFFYFNAHYLLPRYLKMKNVQTYLLALGISFLGFLGFGLVFDYIFHTYVMEVGFGHILAPIRDVSFDMLYVIVLSTAYRFILFWFENEHQKKQAEINLLKSQVNPHFLFNTLNSIYSLAHQKSDKTEDAVLKLSQLMRYMIYDANKNKVALSKEVDYLNDFIELQKLRTSKNVAIVFSIEGDLEQHTIEPMLLIPFVENAFKYGISYAGASEIVIRLEVQKSTLSFSVENTINEKQVAQSENENASGFGIANVQDRLKMLYPGKHELQINKKNGRHNVQLRLFDKNEY
jgi:two-component system LytT family sensor kinase